MLNDEKFGGYGSCGGFDLSPWRCVLCFWWWIHDLYEIYARVCVWFFWNGAKFRNLEKSTTNTHSVHPYSSYNHRPRYLAKEEREWSCYIVVRRENWCIYIYREKESDLFFFLTSSLIYYLIYPRFPLFYFFHYFYHFG